MKFPAIKEHHLYNKAYRQGKHFFGRYICIYVLKDTHAKLLQKSHPQRLIVNRFGISVSKKIGTAVKRNRAKRIIRAAYASLEDKLKTGYLIVVSAKPEIEGRKAFEIENEMRYAIKKLDMFAEQPGKDK
ncbi:MAG: ribonuclease P protein component [Ruminococcaceae bacterium]|nr:ribonuclease P protein component [Oscillospiraceae bacterium]